MDPATVVSGAGTVVTVAKKLYELVQKSNDPQLLAQILELQRAAFVSEDERRAMRDRIAELEQELRDKRRLVYDKAFSAYFDEATGDGPFCSKCADAESKVVRPHELDRGLFRCPNCNTTVETTARVDRLETQAAQRKAQANREYGDY